MRRSDWSSDVCSSDLEPTVGEALRVLQRGLLDIVRRLPVLIAQAQALPSRERLLQPEKAQAKAHLRTNKGNFRPTDPTAVGFPFKRRSGERFSDDWCNRRPGACPDETAPHQGANTHSTAERPDGQECVSTGISRCS